MALINEDAHPFAQVDDDRAKIEALEKELSALKKNVALLVQCCTVLMHDKAQREKDA